MRVALLFLPLLLAACEKEPTFEDRYDNATREVETRARTMDADIARAEGEAEAGPVAEAER